MTMRHANDFTLGAAIRTSRKAAGLTLRDLAAQSGVSSGQLSRIENDETAAPGSNTLRSIAGALGRPDRPLMYLGGQLSFQLLYYEMPEHAAWSTLESHWPLDRVNDLYDTLTKAQPGSPPYEEAEVEARHFAFDAFVLMRRGELLENAGIVSHGGDSPMLKIILDIWPELTAERQGLLAAAAEDQLVLSQRSDPRIRLRHTVQPIGSGNE